MAAPRELLAAAAGGAALVLAAQWALRALHVDVTSSSVACERVAAAAAAVEGSRAREGPVIMPRADTAGAGTAPDAAAAACIMEEQLSRCSTFFGAEAFLKIRGALVVVVGLGGVGASARRPRLSAPLVNAEWVCQGLMQRICWHARECGACVSSTSTACRCPL